MAHIQRVFLNVSMNNRLQGLSELARESGIKTGELTNDSYLVFVNAKRNKIAMLVGPHAEGRAAVMAYVALEAGRTVDLRVIAEIPRAFDGKKLNYDKALELALDKSIKSSRKEIHAL